MGQKTTNAIVQSQNYCLVVRVCEETYVEHRSVYSSYQIDIGSGFLKRAFVTHRNAVTTALKRTNGCDGKERKEMLKEDLERNVTLCLNNSFCSNRKISVDPLPCCKQR